MYDYIGGKADWTGAGLPVTGADADTIISRVVHADVATCSLEDGVSEVAERIASTPYPTAFVVNETAVVLGRVFASDLQDTDATSAGQVMRPGPSTFRPDVPIPEMAHYMRDHDIGTAPVTTSDGRLVGIVLRDELERIHRTDHD